jgi:hypothetical protein
MITENQIKQLVTNHWRNCILYNQIRHKAYRIVARTAYGEQTRHKWRVKRMKKVNRLNHRLTIRSMLNTGRIPTYNMLHLKKYK